MKVWEVFDVRLRVASIIYARDLAMYPRTRYNASRFGCSDGLNPGPGLAIA